MKVLITGASSGIGRDMAKEFAERKYDLVIVARDEKRLNELKTELEVKYKINVKTEVKDLSDEENCISLYEENKDIDILVNNAGFGVFGEFTKTDIQKELNLIKTNVIAVHILTKLYLKDMVEKNSGKILNVSSIAGSMPGPLMCAYYSSKAYVLRLSEGIREELNKKKSNVIIFLISTSTFVGGLIMCIFNNVFKNEFIIGLLLSITVGMLVYINIIEILPKLIKSKDKKMIITSIIVGILILFVSVFLE